MTGIQIAKMGMTGIPTLIFKMIDLVQVNKNAKQI